MTPPRPPLRRRPLTPLRVVLDRRRENSIDSRAGIAAEGVRRGTTTAQPRPFQLVRRVDVSGVSGTGVVAEGVQFTDGSVALRWTGATPATSVWDHGIESMLAVHGHGDASVVEWLDHSSFHRSPMAAGRVPVDFEYPLSTGLRVPTASVDGLCVRCWAAWPCFCPDLFEPAVP